VLYYFYLGELELLTENFVASARAYNDCLSIEVYGGDQTYQMLASMRVGEIHGHEGRYNKARDYYEKAAEYSHAGYLFDFMLQSRRHFYELLDDGTIKTDPTLLLQQSMIEPGPPLTDNQ
jgi:tetratricopeptide (TPR) repeat protein